MQIIQRQLDNLSALCTFCTRAYRDIFPRLELFSISSIARNFHPPVLLYRNSCRQSLRRPTKNEPSVQLRSALRSGNSTGFARTEKNRRDHSLHGFSFSFLSRDKPSTSTTATADCSSKQELPSPSTRATANSSSTSLQPQRQARNFPLRYCLYCHSSRPSLQLP